MASKSLMFMFGVAGVCAFPFVLMFAVLFLAPLGMGGMAVAATCDEVSQSNPLPPGGAEGTVQPVDDIRVSSGFGERWGTFHHGTDYPSGGYGAPIYAYADGVVSRVKANPGGYGHYIVIDHNIDGKKFSTLYAHSFASQIEVTEGDNVKAGQGIARIGYDGDIRPPDVSGSHLHFEYHPGGYGGLDSAVDAHPYVKAAKPVSEANNQNAAAMRAAFERPSDPGDGGDDTDVGGIPLPKPDGPGIDHISKAGPIPENYLAAYKKAGQDYNLPWQLLAGIGWVETQHGQLDAEGVKSGYNDAAFPDEPEGCCAGPMQFNANPNFRDNAPGQTTWDAYKTDGNGDGVMNVYDIQDAAPSAAKKLVADGVKGGSEQAVRSAILRYNNPDTYVNSVLESAWVYADGEVPTIPGEDQGQCQPGGGSLVGGGDTSPGKKGNTDVKTDWPAESATRPDPYTDGAKITPRMANLLNRMNQSGSRPSSEHCHRDPSEDSVGDHSSGVACDFMYTPANTQHNKDAGWAMANWLVANQKTLGVEYVIWQGKKWSSTNQPDRWRPYESRHYSCPDPSNITGCHYDHVHVTVF
ncbi:MAG: peptidoglycan DD-metalloendopeptidase family protein [Streptosporangiales bacterium]|nr:peptidoglycan DD-metalloendopeptidase family protein [Streptosporangiales bacterium]